MATQTEKMRTKGQMKYFEEPGHPSDFNNFDAVEIHDHATKEHFIEAKDSHSSPKSTQPSKVPSINSWIIFCDSLEEVADVDKNFTLGNIIMDDVIIGNGKQISDLNELNILEKRINRAAVLEYRIDETNKILAARPTTVNALSETTIVCAESTNNTFDEEKNCELIKADRVSNQIAFLGNTNITQKCPEQPQLARNILTNYRLNERLRKEVIEGRPFKYVIADTTVCKQCPICEHQMTANASEWMNHFKHHTGEFHLDLNSHQQTGFLYGFTCPGCFLTTLSRQRMVEHIMDEHKIIGDLRHAYFKFKLMHSAGKFRCILFL